MRKTMPVTVLALSVLACGPALAKPDHGRLPPGLQKKVERGGQLPPGWKRKLDAGEVLDVRVYRAGRVEPMDGAREKVYIEDKVIRVIKKTREIIDILEH